MLLLNSLAPFQGASVFTLYPRGIGLASSAPGWVLPAHCAGLEGRQVTVCVDS